MTATSSYAVLLQQADPPTADQLKRAFRAFSNLTDADATRLACCACGILMKHLGWDASRALQLALQAEGVATAIVAAVDLPQLAPARFIRRLDLAPATLTIYDPLGRAIPIDWRHVLMIVAGAVRHFETTRTREERIELRFSPVRGLHPQTVGEVRHKVEADVRLVLEILLAGAVVRFETEAGQFLFKPLIDAPALSIEDKFNWLVRELCARAPHAVLNRGARGIRSGHAPPVGYVNRQALADETVWLLWHLNKQKREQAGH